MEAKRLEERDEGAIDGEYRSEPVTLGMRQSSIESEDRRVENDVRDVRDEDCFGTVGADGGRVAMPVCGIAEVVVSERESTM